MRCFLHLRPGPKDTVSDDTFVVCDYIEPVGAAGPPTWVLHSIDPAKIDGDRFVIARDPGRLVGQVIWPEKPRMNLVGGPGKEYFVDGRNYPPTQKKPDPEAGAWRIELPFSRQALVVLHAGAKTSPLPPPVRMEGVGGSIGFRVTKVGLRFDVKFGKSAAAPPWVEVFEGDQCVETLKLGR